MKTKPKTKPKTAPVPVIGEVVELPAGVPVSLSIEKICLIFDMSKSAIHQRRSAGTFPKPDWYNGDSPRWDLATIKAWKEAQPRERPAKP